jgi:hypothetical protein
MRRIAANLVFPVISPPLKNAMVTLEDDGTVVSVGEGTDRFRERAGVEFYSGILIPGMADADCGSRDSSWLVSRGIRVGGRTGMPDDAGTVPEKGGRVKWKGWPGMIEFLVYDEDNPLHGIFRAGITEGTCHAVKMGGIPVTCTCGKAEMIDLLFYLQEQQPEGSLESLIAMATINGARALGFPAAGSLLPGMQPGLNIIEGADIRKMRLLPGSRLRRLL